MSPLSQTIDIHQNKKNSSLSRIGHYCQRTEFASSRLVGDLVIVTGRSKPQTSTSQRVLLYQRVSNQIKSNLLKAEGPDGH